MIRSRVERGGHNLAALRSLEPPSERARLHAQTEELWERNLDVFRAYEVRLDRVSNRRSLLRAIDPLTSARPALEKRFVAMKAGLQKLGGRECEIDLYVERPVPLPPLETSRPRSRLGAARPAAAPTPSAAPGRTPGRRRDATGAAADVAAQVAGASGDAADGRQRRASSGGGEG